MTAAKTFSPLARRIMLGFCILAWIGAFIGTHVPVESLPGELPGSDLLLHLIGYALLAGIFWKTLRIHGCDSPRRRILIVLITLAFYGLFDEISQPWFGRDFAWADWGADLLGVATMVVCCEFIAFLGRTLSR
jgi:hypothetical protein